MRRIIFTSCHSRANDASRSLLIFAVCMLAMHCWHSVQTRVACGEEISRRGNTVRFNTPVTGKLPKDVQAVITDQDAGTADEITDEEVQLVAAAAELNSLDSLEAMDEVRELGGRPEGHPGPACCVPTLPECCCGRREFWIVNTRCAPTCKGLDQGLDKITYWKEEGRDNWVEHTLEEFLVGADKTLPTTFWVHGNTLDNDGALVGARRVYDNVGRGVPSFRLVLWSWPAEHIKHVSPSNNIAIKWERSESQGYYLAWLVDQLDPRVPITLAGHSFGSRTVTAALQALATNYIAGHHLPPRHFVGWRPMQAALIAAGMDNNLLQPGYRHGLALTQIDRILITVNPQDRTLKVLARFSPTCSPCLGTTGIPNMPALGEQLRKVVQVYPNTWVGKAHRFSKYANSPETAAMMRPYIFYWQSAPLEDIVSPPADR
jgi:hypothetical protein